VGRRLLGKERRSVQSNRLVFLITSPRPLIRLSPATPRRFGRQTSLRRRNLGAARRRWPLLLPPKHFRRGSRGAGTAAE
jgi:hypothetical protein